LAITTRLGALVANLVEADLYVILTDQQGLYDRNPRQFAGGWQLIREGRAGDVALERHGGRQRRQSGQRRDAH
jgi:glutamate 5-kinase